MSGPVTADQVTPEAETWQKRIVGYGAEAPDQLMANPRNWRIHSANQQAAVEAALERVGWVRDVIVNKTTGHVVDGHLRVGLAISRSEPSVPVTYVKLTEDEERVILATHDPLASLAMEDDEAYEELKAAIPEDALSAILGDIAEEPLEAAGDPVGAGADPSATLEVVCPHCYHTFELTQPNV